MSEDRIVIENAPAISELVFRHFRGESDYGPIAAVLTGSDRADHLDRFVTPEFIAEVFTKHLTNCDPYTDMIFTEIAGEMVGYARGWWAEEPPSRRLYMHNGFLLPTWRRKGIGTVLLNWMGNRLKDISVTHPRETEKYLQVNVSQFQEGTAILLEHANYHPIRYFCLMVRPNLDDIPDFPLPPGLEIRPATAEHYQAIWEHMDETSQDEWGYSQPTEKDYQEWLTNSKFQPHLWQIAWDKDSNNVIGTVLTYINHEENKQLDKKRGYTEGIGVSREWRRRGVARALVSQSLRAQKAAGMSESALVADSESTNGVIRLYDSCGFQIVNRDAIYRKPL
jgi:ribosomal protein S18 acetylase RimI-like enzyme